MANINGKPVLLNVQYLIHDNQVVEERGAVPLKIKIGATSVDGIDMQWNGTSFDLSINGLTPDRYDVLNSGSVSWGDQSATWIVRATRIAERPNGSIYEISVTFTAI